MNFVRHCTALISIVALAGCAQQSDESVDSQVSLDTTEDRLSYGIAYGFGQRIKQDGVPVNADVFDLGLRHALNDVEPLLSEEEISAEMQAYQQSRNAELAEQAVAMASANAEAGAAFLAQNAKTEGIVVLPSGLQYKVVTEGDGPKPGLDDSVEVNYRGTLIDGTEFDSSYARNSSATFAVNQVIPGFTEALQIMPVGSSYQFYIPSELAYGEAGAGQNIGPNATLIFDIELLEIKPAG
ncbi:MAG: FKBP-type peptidyl-prolyl cis-trans isomerase [Gammaproteobacteria bacterium]